MQFKIEKWTLAGLFSRIEKATFTEFFEAKLPLAGYAALTARRAAPELAITTTIRKTPAPPIFQ
jgi:hypothetical protein